jgi:pimeloyl-ACP methyl ester carboxylesterase
VSDIHDLKHDRVPDGDAWCASLGVASLGSAARAPVVSDVPVLLLAGEEDLVTPPAWAEAAARHLSRATLIRFPGYGHAVTFATPCALEVVAAFLDDPAVAATSPCLEDFAPPAFEMP